MKRGYSALFGMLWAGAWAQAPVPAGPLPTRLQVCQQELQGVEGEERPPLLRACLLRRHEAERLIAQTCRRQAQEGRADAARRAALRRECERRALALPTEELPQRGAATQVPRPAVRRVAPVAGPAASAPAKAATPAPAQAASPAVSAQTP